MASPFCVALMLHLPVAMRVTVVPEMLHLPVVVDVKLTGRPDEAVALRVNVAVSNVWLDKVPKVMVCESWLISKLCVTTGAAA